MRTGMALVSSTLLMLGACTSDTLSDAEFEAKIDECLRDAALREGESLDTGFQTRAARAHCEKIVSQNSK